LGYLNKILIIVFCITVQLSAGTALDLIDIGTSAESIALGGVYSVSDTAHSIFLNPARLGHNIRWSADVFHTKTISDVTIQNMSVSTTYKKYSLGVGHARTSMAGILRTVREGNKPKTGKIKQDSLGRSYNYNHELFYFGGKVQLTEFFSAGVTAKLINTQLDTYSGKGLNSDIGIVWKKPSYSIGMSAHNILRSQKMKYGSAYQDEELPFKLIINTSKKFSFKGMEATFHLQAKQQKGQPLYYAGVHEISYNRLKAIKLLIGYRTMPHLDKTISRQSVGVNLEIKGIKLSYAYEQSKLPIFNHMHYTSLSFSKKTLSKHSVKTDAIKLNKEKEKELLLKLNKEEEKAHKKLERYNQKIQKNESTITFVLKQLSNQTKSKFNMTQLKKLIAVKRSRIKQLKKAIKKSKKQLRKTIVNEQKTWSKKLGLISVSSKNKLLDKSILSKEKATKEMKTLVLELDSEIKNSEFYKQELVKLGKRRKLQKQLKGTQSKLERVQKMKLKSTEIINRIKLIKSTTKKSKK
jgi:hypothetical protein